MFKLARDQASYFDENYDNYDKRTVEAIQKHYFSKKIYLSILMSISYAAARCRPDVLKETAFLSTLTHNLTLSSWKRLFKVCGYLISNTDASFLVHRNTNGHTGIIFKLYGNTVLQKSIKRFIDDKTVELIHVRSENNIADYFTKPIIGVLFWFFLELIVRNHETN